MKWKQFFTLAKSMNADEARDFVLLDVRQPTEYEKARIPGAKLIPLPELVSRMDELDPEKPVIAY
jgi:rhodanese-related sulfurtransferase